MNTPESKKLLHSFLWVLEFSKKAVLICFSFYIIVQIYSMIVMVVSQDYSYLGDLINQTGELMRDCVFAYLLKSGIENIPKIIFSKIKDNHEDDMDEAAG